MEKKPKSPSIKGPSEWLTGNIWMLDPIARAMSLAVRVNAVHFTPGARTGGTRTCSVRRCSSPRGRGGSSRPAARSPGSSRVTSCTRPPRSGIGMARARSFHGAPLDHRRARCERQARDRLGRPRHRRGVRRRGALTGEPNVGTRGLGPTPLTEATARLRRWSMSRKIGTKAARALRGDRAPHRRAARARARLPLPCFPCGSMVATRPGGGDCHVAAPY